MLKLAGIYIDSGKVFQFVHKLNTREFADPCIILLQEPEWILAAPRELKTLVDKHMNYQTKKCNYNKSSLRLSSEKFITNSS